MPKNVPQLSWIDDDPVLAIANTILLSDPGDPTARRTDLLEDDATLAVWRAKAPAWLADLDLDSLQDLRELVREVLDCFEGATQMPRRLRDRLNRLARDAPLTYALDASGELRENERGTDPAARLAREALRLAAAGPQAARRCWAPGCGMFFRPGRSDQRWCTTRCGTRARVGRLRASAG